MSGDHTTMMMYFHGGYEEVILFDFWYDMYLLDKLIKLHLFYLTNYFTNYLAN
jgi:hypothetical protein